MHPRTETPNGRTERGVRIFIATLSTETNTFSPIPTGRAGFMTHGYYRRDGSLGPTGHGNLALQVWRKLAEADGHSVIDSVCAFAQPAGTTLRGVYEELRNNILDDLRGAGPVDMVLLKMHGAMVAYDYDDCEGDVLARVREIVGPDVVVGIELDLHCHLTELMRRSANVIITYKEYPHTDIGDRAAELYALCVATRLGTIKPVIAYHDCRSISMWRTPTEPVKSFVARMQALEGKDGILSVSFGHGFPWGDVADVGAKIVVVADGDMAKAQALADQLGAEIWAMRDTAAPVHDTIDEALDIAADGNPIVLAEVADNAGGGAPSDNTETLQRLVARDAQGAVIGCFWDPVAVSFCMEAGLGASFDLRIGGKCGVASGAPVDLRITVMGLSDNHSQGGLSGGRAYFGPSAWVRAGGIDIILITERGQVFHQDAFTGLGCTLTDKRIIVVKSTQHFYAGFAPIARDVRYVATAGAIAPDYAAIQFTKRTTPYWPRVADPFATNL
jgi:microcystin degradation protein MlrC